LNEKSNRISNSTLYACYYLSRLPGGIYYKQSTAIDAACMIDTFETRKRSISSVDNGDASMESIDDRVNNDVTDVVVPINVFDDHEEKRNKLTWTPEMVRTFVT